MELALSTIILLVIGILVLIGIGYLLVNGFDNFRSNTRPFVEASGAAAVREACNIACVAEDRLTYCCKNFTISSENVKCWDERLELDCTLSCESFSCG